ncbi:MAG: hypothetical protein IJD85_03505 [Oscillospiraceae bacterium]|nr:hypothetical protein [Oscillospiraceae bacterium]
MFKKMRKLSAVLLALTMMLALAVCAYADDSVFKTPTKNDIDCVVIGDISDDGVTVQAEIKSNVSKSINYFIQGDGLDVEFWNNPDLYIEVKLTLKTESSTVTAILPGFTSSWGWVNPSVWDTYLVNGETITIREPLTTYYESFKESGVNELRLQLCSSAEETETVEVEISGLKLISIDDIPPEERVPAASTEEATDESGADADGSADADASSDEQTSDTSSESVVSDTSKDEASDTSTSSGTSSGSKTPGDGGATIVIVIIVVAVVVIGGVVAGVIIYRKKKYY